MKETHTIPNYHQLSLLLFFNFFSSYIFNVWMNKKSNKNKQTNVTNLYSRKNLIYGIINIIYVVYFNIENIVIYE